MLAGGVEMRGKAEQIIAQRKRDSFRQLLQQHRCAVTVNIDVLVLSADTTTSSSSLAVLSSGKVGRCQRRSHHAAHMALALILTAVWLAVLLLLLCCCAGMRVASMLKAAGRSMAPLWRRILCMWL